MVTVYNDNRGVVREIRSVALPSGGFELKFADVADKIAPPSVHVVSRSDPQALDVVEQNYKFDVLTPSRLMERAVGSEITFVARTPRRARKQDTRQRCSPLAGRCFPNGNEIVIGTLGRPVFSSLPTSFVSRPTLVWSLRNRGASRRHELEVAYVTDG